MTLVSLTLGRVEYDAGHDQYLEIRLPEPAAESLQIQGVGIPERLYYRLDATFEAGQSKLQLPLKDVITRAKIKPEDLGVYGWRKQANGKVAFLPVVARSSEQPVQKEVIAIISPGGNVSDVQWRRYSSGSATDYAPVAGGSGFVPEGTRLEIPLGTAIANNMVLDVSYLSDGMPLSDQFIITAH